MARLVELTVNVEEEPTHGDVAAGDVKLDILGVAVTLKVAVLVQDKLVVHDNELVMPVIVTVVDPPLLNEVAGIANVPLLEPIVNVAVFPVELFAPLKL